MSLSHPSPFPVAPDIRTRIFHGLMPFKVQEILVVSSPYDAFILEEDGSLAARIITSTRGLTSAVRPA